MPTRIVIMYKSVRGNGKARSKNKHFSLSKCKTQLMLHKIYMQC